MKSITTSCYTFEDLIKGNYAYVDKTAQVLKLIEGYKGQYFLSRPRRFGKSLMISTLKAIFQGRRELFKDLAIDASDYDWKTYPVIHLDMGSSQAATPELTENALKNIILRNAADNNVVIKEERTAAENFLNLVGALAEKSPEGKVVILVDEYDKPLLGHLGKSEALAFRDILKSFYSVIKTTEAKQRFAFITGVSKFSKVSIFSDLNNLTDLTMTAQAATLLGYTKEELLANFSEHIEKLAEAMGLSYDGIIEKLTRWYDGYLFEEKSEKIFNPVSVGKSLTELKLKNYWFETATPTFLIDLLKKNVLDLENLTAQEKDFSTYEVENPSVLALLVQTGYLTIAGFEQLSETERIYHLDFPNLEVRNSFNDYLLAGFANIKDIDETQFLYKITSAVRAGDIDLMLETTKGFFANIPYDITLANEKYYQTIFYSLFTLIGLRIKAEVTTNSGRIDAVIETEKAVYVFEFKLNGTAKSAIKQIHDKKYYEKYLASGKEIKLIGAAFNKKTRNLGKWIIESV